LAKNDDDRATWAFVSILSQKKPRAELLKHLGFDQETLEKRLHEFIDSLPVPPGLEVIKGGQARQSNGSADPKPKDVSSLFEGSSEMSFDFGQAPPSDMPPKNEAASNGVVESAPLFITNSALKTVEFTSPDKIESAVLQSLVAGDFAAGVECCLRVGRYADALVLAACGGNDLWRKTRDAFFQLQEKESPSIALLSRYEFYFNFVFFFDQPTY
jgi:protein transport protein SEC31